MWKSCLWSSSFCFSRSSSNPGIYLTGRWFEIDFSEAGTVSEKAIWKWGGCIGSAAISGSATWTPECFRNQPCQLPKITSQIRYVKYQRAEWSSGIKYSGFFCWCPWIGMERGVYSVVLNCSLEEFSPVQRQSPVWSTWYFLTVSVTVMFIYWNDAAVHCKTPPRKILIITKCITVHWQ